MSEGIDWSKAPEGFPLWLEFKAAEHRVHSGWYRKDGNYFKGHYGAHWPEYRTGQFFNVHYKSDKHLINDAYLAPLHPSPAWTGEGLPPVGMVCNVQDADGDWHECQIIAHHLHNAVFVPHVAYPYGVYDGLPADRFRPIRTPEQIAADEREAAITDIAVIMGKDPDHIAIRERAAVIYDAGYRKIAADPKA